MDIRRLFSVFYRLAAVFLLLFLAACPFQSSHNSTGSLSISSPAEGASVSGLITVEGDCSRIDDLTVVIDNDNFTKRVVSCSRGNWSAEFDTSYFQDGDHALVAYKDKISDQIQISTANGNLQGSTLTVPVSLADGIYDEIDSYTPLYVYVRKTATGLIIGKRFTLGTFPGEFEIPNLLNGVYEVGAFLDRNDNQIMDEGSDFAGMAAAPIEISNKDEVSGNVQLEFYVVDDGSGSEPGIFNPGDVSGTVGIENPQENALVSGTLDVTGVALGSIENVQVSIDSNLVSAQVVPVGVKGGWSVEFDTTRLQDGAHYITARANNEIEDTVYFTTDNSNVQGYDVVVSVELTPGLFGEVDTLNPLFVYVEDPVSGARQFAKHESGDFGAESAFVIENVPNNTYRVGAFFDRNNNGVADTGDYMGTADELLNVWYADASASVALHGNEVHIISPAWGTQIRTSSIEMSGTYLGAVEEIEVSMRLTGADYRETTAIANFNAGEWNATLDISDVTQEGTRWLNVRAKYGSRYLWDSIQVILNRTPHGVAIEVPANNETIQTNSFTASGSYDGDPGSVVLLLDRGGDAEISVLATRNNSGWTANFTDLTGVQTGLILHTLTAVADYGGGLVDEDEISIYINPVENRAVAITIPADGDTVTTDNLVVQGTYDGSPQSITVNFETGGSSDLSALVSSPSGDAWSVEFADISSVINGQRTITATADYGGGDVEVASISVNVNRPTTATELNILPEMPYFNEGGWLYFIINSADDLDLYGLFSTPTPVEYNALRMDLLPSDTDVNFNVGSTADWTLISSSHNNPVSETVTPSYILQRKSTGDYYKLTIGFNIQSGLNGGLQYSIESLGAWNCGNNSANCP